MAVRRLGRQAVDWQVLFRGGSPASECALRMKASIKQACILVGGKGTRLGDITRAIPKPLLDMGEGITFLDLLIEQVARQGFNDLVLLAGYLGDLIQARYHFRPFRTPPVRSFI